MANYPIGRLIAEMRGRQGLSQEELAGGICSVSTISKIENGAQMPKRKVYEALLQRLGLTTRSCTVFVSDEDMRRSILETRIEGLIADKRYDEAWSALAEYAVGNAVSAVCMETKLNLYMKMREELSVLEMQYAFCQLALLIQEQQKDTEKALALYVKAAQMTMPGFSLEEPLMSKLLSQQEVDILYRIAILQYVMGERRRAKGILFFLKEYMEIRPVDPQERAIMYPRILHALSDWMGQDGRFDQQLALCEFGIDLCAKQMKECALPYLLEEKGYALAARLQVDQAGSIWKQAYFVFLAIGDSANAKRLKNKAREQFHIDIMACSDEPE